MSAYEAALDVDWSHGIGVVLAIMIRDIGLMRRKIIWQAKSNDGCEFTVYQNINDNLQISLKDSSGKLTVSPEVPSDHFSGIPHAVRCEFFTTHKKNQYEMRIFIDGNLEADRIASAEFPNGKTPTKQTLGAGTSGVDEASFIIFSYLILSSSPDEKEEELINSYMKSRIEQANV